MKWLIAKFKVPLYFYISITCFFCKERVKKKYIENGYFLMNILMYAALQTRVMSTLKIGGGSIAYSSKWCSMTGNTG